MREGGAKKRSQRVEETEKRPEGGGEVDNRVK